MELQLELSDGTKHPHKGRVIFVDRQVDPQAATIRLVAAFPNPRNVLRYPVHHHPNERLTGLPVTHIFFLTQTSSSPSKTLPSSLSIPGTQKHLDFPSSLHSPRPACSTCVPPVRTS